MEHQGPDRYIVNRDLTADEDEAVNEGIKVLLGTVIWLFINNEEPEFEQQVRGFWWKDWDEEDADYYVGKATNDPQWRSRYSLPRQDSVFSPTVMPMRATNETSSVTGGFDLMTVARNFMAKAACRFYVVRSSAADLFYELCIDLHGDNVFRGDFLASREALKRELEP